MITEITKGQLLALQMGQLKDAGQAQAAPRLDGQAQQRLGGARMRQARARDPRRQRHRRRLPGDPPHAEHRVGLHLRGHARHPRPGDRRSGDRDPRLQPADALREEGEAGARRWRSGAARDDPRPHPRARFHPRHRAGGDRRRPHHGARRPPASPTTSRSRRCARSSTRWPSPAASSSARASATRRRCSSSARRSARSRAGRTAPGVDIAVDPLEGTNLCATGAPDATAVLAAAERGGLLHAPDIYMEKIIVGPTAKGRVHIDAPVAENLRSHRQGLRARRRGPDDRRARPAAPRAADRRHPRRPARASG